MTELSHIDTRVTELMSGHVLPLLRLSPTSWLVNESWRTMVADRIEDWLGMLIESKRILWQLPQDVRTLQGMMTMFGQVTRNHESRLQAIEQAIAGASTVPQMEEEIRLIEKETEPKNTVATDEIHLPYVEAKLDT